MVLFALHLCKDIWTHSTDNNMNRDLATLMYISIYIYIYIYIKWTVFVNVTTKSAQHAHVRMTAIFVEQSPNSSHMYDHGFMDNANRQAVKNWLNSQTRDATLTSWLPSIGIIHETMVVHMTWIWTFFNNYIYIYIRKQPCNSPLTRVWYNGFDVPVASIWKVLAKQDIM